MPLTERLQPHFDWLLDGAPDAGSLNAVVGRTGRALRTAGIPVERLAAFVRTLHPNLAGQRFTWTPNLDEAEASALAWGDLQTPEFLAGPLAQVFSGASENRVRLEGSAPLRFAGLQALREQGLSDFVALPLRFVDHTFNALTLATAAPAGFTDEQLEALRWLARPLARVAETRALMRTAANLLDTYVGRNAGERILRGQIQRGDAESIRCVIWFSDLRGFTSLSADKTPAETISVLNQLFDCQVPAIERRGGEVLKFIGDGMLAIWAISAQRTDREAAAAALQAAGDAFAALDALNATRSTPIRFGLALHAGDVGYGNIGGASRLDFTAIGAAVNLAARIEGLTGKLDKRVLVSEPLAGLLPGGARPVGTYELKGLPQPQAIYEPVLGQ